jgi:hypothetical protein
VGVAMSAADRTLCRQRQVEAIHRLGARVVFEFVDEIARRHSEIATDLDARLARYANIDPDLLEAVGGTRLIAYPIWAFGGQQ